MDCRPVRAAIRLCTILLPPAEPNPGGGRPADAVAATMRARPARGTEEAVRQLVRVAELAEPQQQVVEFQAEPADNRVLECAAEGRAEAIVSGDRDLLALASWRGMRIESAAQFL